MYWHAQLTSREDVAHRHGGAIDRHLNPLPAPVTTTTAELDTCTSHLRKFTV